VTLRLFAHDLEIARGILERGEVAA